jgi:hypothetical protein
MKLTTRFTFSWTFLAIGATLAGCFLALPTRLYAQNTCSGAQGQNGVYNATCNNQSPGVTGSSAFIDASMFVTVTGTNICGVLHSILSSNSYPPTGAVIDARGLANSTPATSMTCTMSPWGSGSSYLNVPSTILLPATGGATPNPIIIPNSSPWILPANTHLIGEGDGIPSSGFTPGTAIQAGTGFSGSMIQFGTGPPPSSPLICPLVGTVYTCTGISVENLTLDGKGQSINGISNAYSQDGSYVNHVSLYQIRDVGLVIQGGAQGNANNSGPYSNIAYDLGGNAGNPSTVCAEILGNLSGSGLHGLTCISESKHRSASCCSAGLIAA